MDGIFDATKHVSNVTGYGGGPEVLLVSMLETDVGVVVFSEVIQHFEKVVTSAIFYFIETLMKSHRDGAILIEIAMGNMVGPEGEEVEEEGLADAGEECVDD
ncbi:uncharacterized protein BXIN_2215 [Babesia sp. Xinjiang]|uniref:uncharacterized protein n=1 Tax=Babesia sp. Xinjiang TaxID=462227 RepID=UPI000A2534DE|nr:uncharacterized protein BXIN_2215 [Babesia sp. Xinjiang]ORM39605.1 hypothetical protein BXIN_2215 [Babesia sp. Xinjiang]